MRSFGGRLKNFINNWTEITSDSNILDLIKGVKLDFLDCPQQVFVPSEYKFSEEDKLSIGKTIEDFLNKGIIDEVEPVSNQIISNIFCRKKKSGKARIICNLVNINKEMEYIKFKQDTVKTVLDLVRPNCFMCSIDLKDAYYCINVHEDSRKFLRFRFDEQLYEFTCLAQ